MAMSETSPEEKTNWNIGEVTRGTQETQTRAQLETEHFTLFSVIGHLDAGKPAAKVVELQTFDSKAAQPMGKILMCKNYCTDTEVKC